MYRNYLFVLERKTRVAANQQRQATSVKWVFLSSPFILNRFVYPITTPQHTQPAQAVPDTLGPKVLHTYRHVPPHRHAPTRTDVPSSTYVFLRYFVPCCRVPGTRKTRFRRHSREKNTCTAKAKPPTVPTTSRHRVPGKASRQCTLYQVLVPGTRYTDCTRPLYVV